ncbi:MAG: spore cortex-lytic enzyme [Clostridia bacterium]|nr:spore cortex-lytic enzyme [Clostridia bacterium]
MKTEKKAYLWYRAAISLILVFTVLIFASYVKKENTGAVYTLSKIGSRGDEVRQIQKKLRELGYYKGSVDGIYGTGTQKAVKAFQKNCGITADGIAGPKTLRYLGLSSSSSGSAGGYSSSDINLLAKLIAAEARGEGYTGQVAVGAVVLNRVAHSSFPDTIAGVIYQKGAFSCVNDSNWSVSPNATSLKAARDCINGWDPSGGAIYYYNPAKTNNSFMFSRPVITTIGSHVFCR